MLVELDKSCDLGHSSFAKREPGITAIEDARFHGALGPDIATDIVGPDKNDGPQASVLRQQIQDPQKSTLPRRQYHRDRERTDQKNQGYCGQHDPTKLR